MVYRYLKDERGIALVIAMGFSILIFASALAFTYRLSSFVRTTRASDIKSQTLYTADAATELLRHYFWINSCSPPSWCTTALGVGTLSQDTYSEVTSGILNLLQSNPYVTLQGYEVVYDGTGKIEIKDATTQNVIDSYDFAVYLRDTSLENTIEVLSSSEQPANNAKASTSAAIIFTIPCADDYKQFGQCVGKEGSSGEVVDTLSMSTNF